MKKLFIITLLFAILNANAGIGGGITVGGGIGVGTPLDYGKYEFCLYEYTGTFRPVIKLASYDGFAIGIEYTYKYQNYTLNERKTRDITQQQQSIVDGSYYTYTYTEEYTEHKTLPTHSHNIGISFTTNLSRSSLSNGPNWWTFGYDIDSKGPFFNANFGLYHNTDGNVMLAFTTYISSKNISMGITLNFQAYTSDDTHYNKSYTSYSTYNSTPYTYSQDTYVTDYNDDTSYYTPDTTSYYYGNSDRVYVRGHYRHYKSGKISYVRPHTRSYPGRGRK